MLGPFAASDVIDRLRVSVPALRLIAGAAELDAALNSTSASTVPAAYVLLARETASASRGSSERVVQQVDVALSVILVARNYQRADLGAAAGADLAALTAAVRGALIGWTPSPADTLPLDLQSGRLESRQGASLWWQEIYRTRYTLEATP